MNPEERRRLLTFCALPMLGPERVLKSLCDILWRKVRRNKTEKIEKYHNAIEQWSHDLDFVLEHETVDLKELSRDILNYVSAVKDHLEKYAHVEGDVPLKKISDISSKKGAEEEKE